MASEVNTPFSSNPPEVFRSLSRSPDPATRDSRATDHDDNDGSEEQVKKMEETSGGVEVQAGSGPGPETRNRRLAAEAAMRRLGITPSPTLPISKGKEKEKEKETETEVAETTPEALTLISTTPDPDTEIGAEQGNWKPFLSIPDPLPPHPSASTRPGLGPRNGNASYGSGYGHGLSRIGLGTGVDGVEDRLRVLREVDEGIWRMIEDLTRLRSQYDVPGTEQGGGVTDGLDGTGANGRELEGDAGVGSGIEARSPGQ